MKKRKILATLTTAALLTATAAAMPLTVGAVGNYTSVQGTETSFDKYLVMAEGANVPNVSFRYTLAAGTAQHYSADSQTIAVYPGPSPEKIAFTGNGVTDTDQNDRSFTVSFVPSDSAVLQKDQNTSDYVKNLDAGEKYAKKTVTLDLRQVTFDEPGIYRYIISEDNTSVQGIVYDADLTRVLDVYVTDASDDSGKKLAVSQYVLHANDSTISINGTTYGSDGKVVSGEDKTGEKDGLETSDFKSQGFTNEYTTHDLTFSKKVEGNQASKDKYFAFTVDIGNAVPGTKYAVSYQDDGIDATTDGNADAQISGQPNSATTVITEDIQQPAVLTVDNDGKIRQVFYLQHGQKIAIRGLAEGTVYTITDGKEDYSPSYQTDDENDTTENRLDVASGSGLVNNVTVDFTNTRDGQIPTGVILAVSGPVILGLVVLGAIVFLIVKNKRREAEED